MKASDKMKLNGYIASGCIKRRGEQYVMSPWSFPSKEEYEALVQAMKEDYVFSITLIGIVAVPKDE